MAEMKHNGADTMPELAWQLYRPVRYRPGDRLPDFCLSVPGTHLRLQMSQAEVLALRTLLNTSQELPSP